MNRADIIDPVIEKDIHAALKRAEEEHEVKILHAIESGSRAWGFHSPDSDYDVRFIYVHKRDWYLSVYQGRDVIEYPIEGVFDISGWDLKKALHLTIKSNAVVMEWLTSPILYSSDPAFVEAMKKFWVHAVERRSLMSHYLHQGERQIDQNWRTSDEIKVKKYLYVLRPAMALRWLRVHGAENLSGFPMNIQDLMAGSDLPPEITREINDLIARKRDLDEGQMTGKIKILDDFATQEYEKAGTEIASLPKVDGEKRGIVKEEADKIFRSWLF